MTDKSDTWADAVLPVSRRLRTSAICGLHHTFNPTGAKALANLLDDMAMKLDEAIRRLNSRREE